MTRFLHACESVHFSLPVLSLIPFGTGLLNTARLGTYTVVKAWHLKATEHCLQLSRSTLRDYHFNKGAK